MQDARWRGCGEQQVTLKVIWRDPVYLCAARDWRDVGRTHHRDLPPGRLVYPCMGVHASLLGFELCGTAPK